MRRRQFLAGVASFVAAGSTAQDREITVTGRAVCLDGDTVTDVSACEIGDAFAIQTESGVLHRLDPADIRVEILTDERVNRHPLEVALWVEEGLGKIIHLHTLQDGETIEPFYFCFTCNITSHIPGPCWCCQQDFEFKERPARTGS